MSDFDILRLDRDLRTTAQRWRAFQRGMKQADQAPLDPYEATRWVSSHETFAELSSLPSDPVVAAARRWVYRLAEQRINQRVLVQLEYSYRNTPHVFDDPEHNRMTLHQIFERILSDDTRRASWVKTFAYAGADLSRYTSVLWERRREIAERMLEGPATSIEGCCLDLEEHAERWLATTDRIWESFSKPRYSDYVALTLGKKADAGWPARLTTATLLDWFRSSHLFSSLNLDPGTLPRALGASSFLRGIGRIGAAWVDATAPKHQPFVIAHDPYGLKRRTYEAFFGMLLATPTFLTQVLKVGQRPARGHRQILGLTLLAHSRVAAMRVLLRPLALQGPRVLGAKIENVCYDALGFPLKLENFGVFFPLQVDDAARFAGLLLGHQALLGTIETHSDDFYRNPRAIDQLRSEAQLSPETQTTPEALKQAAQQFERWLSEALA